MKVFSKLILFTVEKISSELALLAAIISTSHDGEIPRRVLSGMVSIWLFVYGLIDAYTLDAAFSETYAKFTEAFNSAVAAAGKNIMANPRDVLLGMISTFIFYKLIAAILRIIRKKALRLRRNKDQLEKSDKDKGGETYNRLYNDQ